MSLILDPIVDWAAQRQTTFIPAAMSASWTKQCNIEVSCRHHVSRHGPVAEAPLPHLPMPHLIYPGLSSYIFSPLSGDPAIKGQHRPYRCKMTRVWLQMASLCSAPNRARSCTSAIHISDDDNCRPYPAFSLSSIAGQSKRHRNLMQRHFM